MPSRQALRRKEAEKRALQARYKTNISAPVVEVTLILEEEKQDACTAVPAAVSIPLSQRPYT